MNRLKYIISSVALGLLGSPQLLAQQDTVAALRENNRLFTDTNPSSISIASRLYSKAGVFVMDNGNVGASPVIMLRGTNSINLTSSPQLYIDGIPMRYASVQPTFLSTFEPDRLGFLNPLDVETVDIRPSAQYLHKAGGRGSNGILDIRTERGEFGGTKLDFNASYGVNTFDYHVPRFGAQEFKSYLWTRFTEEGMSAQERDVHPIFSTTDPTYHNNTDWLEMIQQKGAFQDYHVKLKGGDGDANYLFSIGYTNKEGSIKNTGFERVGLRFNLDYALSPNVKIYNNLSYTNTSGHYKEFGSNYAVHPIYVAAAKAPFLGTNYFNENGEQSKILAGVDVLGFSNPVALIENMDNKNQFNRVDGVMGVEWTLPLDWRLVSDLSVSYFSLSEKQYRPALGIVPDKYRIRQNAQRSSSEFDLNWNTALLKKGQLSSNMTYDASLKAAIETFEEKSLYGRKINAGTDDFETLAQGIVDSASNTKFRSNLMTLIAQGAINWKNRIDLTAFVNLQGTSNLGANTRWNVYPGIHALFYLAGEKQNNVWNMSLGYDRTGNHEVRGFYHYAQYYPVNYFGYGGVYLGNVANPDLKPEITDTYEIKSNFNLLENRVQVNVGYYYKRTHDLITQQSIAKEIGVNPVFDNAGTIENSGVEVDATAYLVKKQDWNWVVSAAVSTLKNKVLELPNGAVEQTLGLYSGVAMEGEALGAFYGYNVLGVFQNENEVNLNKADGTPYKAGDYRIEDMNEDGKINELDRQVIGSPLPDVFGTLSSSLTYKNWGISALFNFVKGADIYNSFAQQMHAMKDYANQDPAVLDRWTSANTPGSGLSRAAINDPSNNGKPSSLWVEDGSYLKIRNVTLHYDIAGPSDRYFKNIKVYVSVDNLLTFTNYSGFDPEINSMNNAMLRNIDFGAPPLGTTYKLGLKASF